MGKNYLPTKNAAQILWYTNFKLKIQTLGPAIGLLGLEIQEAQQYCDMLIATINDVEAQKANLKAAISRRDTARTNELFEMRTLIGRFKTNTSYNKAIGKDLGVIGSHELFDTANYKPILKASHYAGAIRLKFTKKGTQGVNIYHRKKGDMNWGFLVRHTKSPYTNAIKLAIDNQPEHWEYRAIGVINDKEIGQASDIVEIVFGS